MERQEEILFPRRIYPMEAREMTEEELAVVFAMTSRRPEPFDQIRNIVTTEKAADFHERWVLGYGHASVAEHAIIHLAVENISRLACDTLEDNRLASYTEKSSRYQIIDQGFYHTPEELAYEPKLKQQYTDCCNELFKIYQDLLNKTQSYLATVTPQGVREREGAYNLRLRRQAIDSCRFVLPSSTLTNVGVSMNARSMEHAIRKLLSSDLEEERQIGDIIKSQGRKITPTLIRYADENEYLILTRKEFQKRVKRTSTIQANQTSTGKISAKLLYFDKEAETKLAASLLYHYNSESHHTVARRVRQMSRSSLERTIKSALGYLGPHDATVRELEFLDYTFEFVLDYGAYREFKRHRMQSYIPQPLTVKLGYIVPPLIQSAGLESLFVSAMMISEQTYCDLSLINPRVAEYVVTHAHCRRVISKMNLRECYHFFKLRTQPQAHFTIQEASRQALEEVRSIHPLLVEYIQTRKG